MLAEQGDNGATALLNIGACSRAVGGRVCFAHTLSRSPHRQSRANLAGFVAVYLTVC
jgi:hypothetical protein